MCFLVFNFVICAAHIAADAMLFPDPLYRFKIWWIQPGVPRTREWRTTVKISARFRPCVEIRRDRLTVILIYFNFLQDKEILAIFRCFCCFWTTFLRSFRGKCNISTYGSKSGESKDVLVQVSVAHVQNRLNADLHSSPHFIRLCFAHIHLSPSIHVLCRVKRWAYQ